MVHLVNGGGVTAQPWVEANYHLEWQEISAYSTASLDPTH